MKARCLPVWGENQLLAAVPVVQEACLVHHEHGLLMCLLIQRLRCKGGSATLAHSCPGHIAVQSLKTTQKDP